MFHVLISAASADQGFAHQLRQDLEQAGLKTKVDDSNTALDTLLNDVGQVVVVLSPHSQESERLGQILAFARDNELNLIPIRYQFAPLPILLQDSPLLDMQSSTLYKTGVPELIAVLQGKQSLYDVMLPQNLHIHDTRNHCPHDLRRYLSILALISSPIAAEDGKSAPRQVSDHFLVWARLAGAFAGLKADGVQGLFLQRLLPPTPGNLSEILQGHFRILHIQAPTYDGGLILENGHGHETELYPQHLANMLQESAVELLFLHGELRQTDSEILLEETPLQALLQISVDVDTDTIGQFSAALYTQLVAGNDLVTILSELAPRFGISNEDLSLHFSPNQDNYRLARAPQAATILIDDGLPAKHNIPRHIGFVGHRAPLSELSREITSSDYRQIAIYGSIESGKSWLAAEYATRYGWRYPDGILWHHVSARTKSEDIVGQLLAMLELPPTTHWNTLREILREKQVLIILDQLDQWDDPLEVGELADFIARLDHLGGTRILLTSWGPVQPITYTSDTEENYVEALASDEAQHLVRRYIEAYGLQDIFSQEAAITAFAEVTQQLPWLIREAIQIVQRDGLSAALEAIQELTRDVSDAFEAHMIRQINELSPDAIRALHVLQGLPDGFTLDLVHYIAPNLEPPVLRELLRLDMLQRNGTLYRVPLIVRIYLRHYLPLSAADQDAIDAQVTSYLVGEQQK